MTVLKVVAYDWKNASRDKRELSVYKELGHEVLVMCKGNPDDYMRKDIVDGFDVLRCTTRPLGTKVPLIINRIVSGLIWIKFIRQINPDVISGENPDGALIGVIAKKGIKNKRVKLIYDAHEFHLYTGKNSSLKRRLLKLLEKYILKNADLTIVVNDSILSEMKIEYNFSWNAVSILSTPYYFNIDYTKVKQIRTFFDSKINPNGERFIIEYHGYINRMRSIELLIDLLSINKNLSLVLIGSADGDYLLELENKAKKLGVGDRVLFNDMVDMNELGDYLSAVDLGIVIFKAFYKNLYYCSPNKFFENIQAENPIICSAFPEMKKIIDKYNIGMTIDSCDVNVINNSIEKMRTDKELYNTFKNNIKDAKERYCWENEKQKYIIALTEHVLC